MSIQAHADDVTEEQYRALKEPYDNLLRLQEEIVFGKQPEPSEHTWTRAYQGVSHCGDFGTEKTWLTAIDYGSFALLHIHHPGCGFSPDERKYDTIAAAKTAGEKILDNL